KLFSRLDSHPGLLVGLEFAGQYRAFTDVVAPIPASTTPRARSHPLRTLPNNTPDVPRIHSSAGKSNRRSQSNHEVRFSPCSIPRTFLIFQNPILPSRSPTSRYLELAELDLLSRALNLTTPTIKVSTRIEAFSCKAISRDKKLLKTLESDLIQDISHSTSISPPEHHRDLLESAFGPLDQRASRKTLWLLVSLLNVAFPDHDFSKVRPEEFRRENGPWAVLGSLSSALDQLRTPESQRSFSSWPASTSVAFPTSSSSSPFNEPIPLPPPSRTSAVNLSETNPFLRSVLDPVIDLAECEVFSYSPDPDSDPNAADSDDDDGSEDGNDDYEPDDEGALGWEMDGLSGGAAEVSAGYFGAGPAGVAAGPSWQGGYGTPVKSFKAFLPPGTPTGSESEWGGNEKSAGSLLWSSHYFLFNKKMKRIVFISSWGSSRNRPGPTQPSRRPYSSTAGPVSRMKRTASTSSITSVNAAGTSSVRAKKVRA
ncbi:repressor of RNA polymerase III transcription MAF1, partial [Phenoliferia sp. Uapishka_3]